MSTLQKNISFGITLDTGVAYTLDAGSTTQNIGEVIQRDTKVPFASEVTLLLIGAAIAAGQLTDIKAFIIKNVDDVNFVRIRFEDTGGHTVDHKLLPGDTYTVYNTQVSVSETGAAFASWSTIDTISAQADTGDVSVSILAAEPC
jgi:hypothetical protein